MEQNINIVRKLLKEKSLSINIVLYFVSLLVPFITTIIWGWAFLSEMCLVNIAIYAICFSFGVVLTFFFVKKTESKIFRIGIISFFIAAIIFFITTFDLQLSLSKRYYIWSKQEKLNAFVKEINEYGKIKNMDAREILTLHGERIEIKPEYEDDAFKKTLILYGIDPEKYFKFRDYLQELDILGFCKNGKTYEQVCFLMSGFLDESSGFVYSESDEMPEVSCRGPMKVWYKILDNWYAFAGWSD